ncbi:MAG: hypothetical protein OQK95_01985 [Gammaproteobacteria bacterium]|nr:hypothetical protein [Gammaproteobacteria bacterium]
MVKPLYKLVLALSISFAILSSLVSCTLSPDAMETLDSSIRSYERAIRWGDFTRAKSFHKNAPTLSDLERRRLKFYRVTDYSVLQHNTTDKYNSLLMVEVKYYKNDLPVVKTITAKQHWKREKESNIWYLDSEFPKFR